MGKHSREEKLVIIKELVSLPVRKWAYGIGIASLGVAAVYGYVNDQQVLAFSNLIGAVTLGMARAHTPENEGE